MGLNQPQMCTLSPKNNPHSYAFVFGAIQYDGGSTKEKEIKDGRQMNKRRKLDNKSFTNITPQKSMIISIEASEKEMNLKRILQMKKLRRS